MVIGMSWRKAGREGISVATKGDYEGEEGGAGSKMLKMRARMR